MFWCQWMRARLSVCCVCEWARVWVWKFANSNLEINFSITLYFIWFFISRVPLYQPTYVPFPPSLSPPPPISLILRISRVYRLCLGMSNFLAVSHLKFLAKDQNKEFTTSNNKILYQKSYFEYYSGTFLFFIPPPLADGPWAVRETWPFLFTSCSCSSCACWCEESEIGLTTLTMKNKNKNTNEVDMMEKLVVYCNIN